MRIRVEHQQVCLTSCEKNPELLTNKFNGPDGKSRGNALWQNLTQKLNSMGYGEKTKEEWRKTFTDWKCKTKSKASKIKVEQNRTGGGPAVCPPLSVLENKLINLMGVRAVEGDICEELGFGQMNIEVPQEQVDHDYIENTEEIPSSLVSRRRTTRPNNGPYRRNYRGGEKLSKKLVDLNQESIEILRDLKESMQSVAASLKIIADNVANKKLFNLVFLFKQN